jgi:hypothetical protein
MGYRSDVELLFYTTGEDTQDAPLPQAAVKLWFDENYPVAEAIDDWGADITYGLTYVRIRYENVKWYENYKHIIDVDAAKAKFKRLFGDRAACEHVRVGEESADIETSGCSVHFGWLSVRSEITFDPD